MSIEPTDAGVTMLYRPGDSVNPDAWNLKVDTRIVDNDGIEVALANGWHLHPSDFPAEGGVKGGGILALLDESAAAISENIPALTKDELAELLDAEQAGKARKGVIAALEAALKAE